MPFLKYRDLKYYLTESQGPENKGGGVNEVFMKNLAFMPVN